METMTKENTMHTRQSATPALLALLIGTTVTHGANLSELVKEAVINGFFDPAHGTASPHKV